MPLVLVAVVSPSLRTWLSRNLEASGYDVVQARKADQVIEGASRGRSDLVLLDIYTPVFDGFAVLKRLKESASAKKVPVITITSVASSREESQSLKLGAIGCIAKGDTNLIPNNRSIMRELDTGEKEAKGREVRRALGVIKTGDEDVDVMLDGGIPRMALAIIEGRSADARAEFCRRLVRQSLLDGNEVTYLTTDHSSEEVVDALNTDEIGVLPYRESDALAVHSFERATPAGHPTLCGLDPDRCEHPERLLLLLGMEAGENAKSGGVVVVDSTSDLASQSLDHIIVRFYGYCRALCLSERTTLIISAVSSPYVAIMRHGRRTSAELGADGVASYRVGEGLVLRVVPT